VYENYAKENIMNTKILNNKSFNFKISGKELKRFQTVAKELGYVSFAEFIRTAIRHFILKERGHKNGTQ